jgi:hypothetical protein
VIRLAQITRGLALYATDDASTTRLVLSLRLRRAGADVELVEELRVADVQQLRDELDAWLETVPDPDELARLAARRVRPSPAARP